jgi:hypothetical protein
MNDKDTPPANFNDESGSKHTFRNRRSILKLFIGACLVIAPLLIAAQIMSGGFKTQETDKERDAMFATTAKAEPNHAIPPVDAHVPARIETATFALG